MVKHDYEMRPKWQRIVIKIIAAIMAIAITMSSIGCSNVDKRPNQTRARIRARDGRID
jgi:hypothetical protein